MIECKLDHLDTDVYFVLACAIARLFILSKSISRPCGAPLVKYYGNICLSSPVGC